MKIKIIKCKDPLHWYARKIGQIYEAEWDSFEQEYTISLDDGGIGWVHKEDAEVTNKSILPIPESTLEWLQARQKELQDYVIQCMEHGDEIRKDITQEYCRNQQRILEIEKC